LAEAEKLERQALDAKLRISGPENLTTIHYMMNEANIKASIAADQDSEDLYRQLLGLERRVLGPEQPETAVTVYNLATVVAKRGRHDEAVSLLRQAVDHGLPPRIAMGMSQDSDLTVLQGDPQFAALLAYIKERAQSAPKK
jgi:hypothetical protein